MGYRSIFLSASYGRKVASMRIAVSPKGAAGIAQFMPATASGHGLADPFEPIDALRHSAAYLRELLDRFGNLACCGRVQCRSRPSQYLANEPPRPAVAEGVATRPSASTILLRTGTGRHRQC